MTKRSKVCSLAAWLYLLWSCWFAPRYHSLFSHLRRRLFGEACETDAGWTSVSVGTLCQLQQTRSELHHVWAEQCSVKVPPDCLYLRSGSCADVNVDGFTNPSTTRVTNRSYGLEETFAAMSVERAVCALRLQCPESPQHEWTQNNFELRWPLEVDTQEGGKTTRR
jgi:hypothetical protein